LRSSSVLNILDGFFDNKNWEDFQCWFRIRHLSSNLLLVWLPNE
jgi:hypothetical protein